MSNPAWKKKSPDSPVYDGVRIAGDVDFQGLDLESQNKIRVILDAMEWPQLIFFNYDGNDRVVAPFVLGVSSEGNPLLRGWQMQGTSRSGKGSGWRVFQIVKMLKLENFQDFFSPSDFVFEEYYPWIYKVFKML